MGRIVLSLSHAADAERRIHVACRAMQPAWSRAKLGKTMLQKVWSSLASPWIAMLSQASPSSMDALLLPARFDPRRRSSLSPQFVLVLTAPARISRLLVRAFLSFCGWGGRPSGRVGI